MFRCLRLRPICTSWCSFPKNIRRRLWRTRAGLCGHTRSACARKSSSARSRLRLSLTPVHWPSTALSATAVLEAVTIGLPIMQLPCPQVDCTVIAVADVVCPALGGRLKSRRVSRRRRRCLHMQRPHSCILSVLHRLRQQPSRHAATWPLVLLLCRCGLKL